MTKKPYEPPKKKGKPTPQSTKAAKTWWWTIAVRAKGFCGDCGNDFAKNQVMAYNRDENTALCEICAENRGLNPTPSKRYRQARG